VAEHNGDGRAQRQQSTEVVEHKGSTAQRRRSKERQQWSIAKGSGRAQRQRSTKVAVEHNRAGRSTVEQSRGGAQQSTER
jgi:hypothetical protein